MRWKKRDRESAGKNGKELKGRRARERSAKINLGFKRKGREKKKKK